MTNELAASLATPGTRLHDIGCAMGTTFFGSNRAVDPGVSFFGIDNSNEMLGKAEAKLAAVRYARSLSL